MCSMHYELVKYFKSGQHRSYHSMVVLSTQVSSSLVLVACVYANLCFTDSKGYNYTLCGYGAILCSVEVYRFSFTSL